MTRLIVAALLGLSLAAPALAHEPRPGPNGGLKVDAGARHHVELLANGTTQVVVFLFDANDQAIPTQGYRANAILVVGGTTQRFTLQPDQSNRMVGTAPAPVPSGVKGAVQITGPDGATAQARF
ncbi:hypothetical protein ACJ4V0_20865 [Phreatobacter sp. HK31-P]|jgi:hypothetical protein